MMILDNNEKESLDLKEQCSGCKQFPKILIMNEECNHCYCYKCFTKNLEQNEAIMFCLDQYCTSQLNSQSNIEQYQDISQQQNKNQYLNYEYNLQLNLEIKMKYLSLEKQIKNKLEKINQREISQKKHYNSNQTQLKNNQSSINENLDLAELIQCSKCQNQFQIFNLIKSTCKQHPYYCINCFNEYDVGSSYEKFCICNCKILLNSKQLQQNYIEKCNGKLVQCAKCHHQQKTKQHEIIYFNCDNCDEITCILHQRYYKNCHCICHFCKQMLTPYQNISFYKGCSRCKRSYCKNCFAQVQPTYFPHCQKQKQEQEQEQTNYIAQVQNNEKMNFIQQNEKIQKNQLEVDNNLYCINCGGTFREHNTRMSNGECYYCYTMPKETIKQGKLKIDEPFPENDTDKASQEQLSLQMAYDLQKEN